MDNRSTDETAELARRSGAKVVSSGAGTIGAVRNEGVRASRGDIVVFLDADCALTESWSSEFPRLIQRVEQETPSCAGSLASPPPDEDVFIWKHWFEPNVKYWAHSHIGSAHLICSRDTFRDLGGFDESLETGEDFDFCIRVQRAGGALLNVPAMRVDHYGFPRTWLGFFRRERWLGRGDAKSVRAFLASKAALVSVSFSALVGLGSLAAPAGASRVSIPAFATAALVLLATSLVKYRRAGVRVQMAILPFLAVYFLARTFSVVDEIGRRLTRKPGRSRDVHANRA